MSGSGSMKGWNGEVLRLAGPSILANITVPLVGMVDIAIAGHLPAAAGAATLIGGITVGSMLFDLLYWNFSFLRAGTGGLTAQAYGQGDRRSASDTLARALGIALAGAILLLLFQGLLVKGALAVVQGSPEVRALAERYFSIRIWAAPATLSLMAFKGWFIGMQDSLRPMAADLIVDGVNIGGSFLLAFGAGRWGGLGFDGIAAGTVLAQYGGLAYALAAVRRKGVRVSLREILTAFRSPDTRRFFRTGGDLFVRSVCFIAVYIGFTLIAARYGDLLLASSAIIMKLMLLFSYFTDGFAYAGEALTGRSIGSRSREGVRTTVRLTFAWATGVGFVFVALNGFAAGPLLQLMTSDAAVVDASRHFVVWLVLMPLIGCPAFTWDGIYIGATASRDLRDASLLSAAGFFAVWGIGRTVTGADGEAAIHLLLAAYLVHLALRALWQTLRYRPAILEAPFR